MEHSQYRHFPSCAREGVEAVVMPAGDRDHIGCFTDQVKLTRALVRDLDNVVKEVKLLGEHGEEARQRITELEALCKRLREDAQKLREEKTKLEGMVKYRDELIMEFADKYGYNRSDEDEDDDNEGNVAAPPAPAPLAAVTEVISINEEDPTEMVPE
jgi:predicted nuclease with TOPRIM domain